MAGVGAKGNYPKMNEYVQMAMRQAFEAGLIHVARSSKYIMLEIDWGVNRSILQKTSCSLHRSSISSSAGKRVVEARGEVTMCFRRVSIESACSGAISKRATCVPARGSIE